MLDLPRIAPTNQRFRFPIPQNLCQDAPALNERRIPIQKVVKLPCRAASGGSYDDGDSVPEAFYSLSYPLGDPWKLRQNRDAHTRARSRGREARQLSFDGPTSTISTPPRMANRVTTNYAVKSIGRKLMWQVKCAGDVPALTRVTALEIHESSREGVTIGFADASQGVRKPSRKRSSACRFSAQRGSRQQDSSRRDSSPSRYTLTCQERPSSTE